MKPTAAILLGILFYCITSKAQIAATNGKETLPIEFSRINFLIRINVQNVNPYNSYSYSSSGQNHNLTFRPCMNTVGGTYIPNRYFTGFIVLRSS